MHKQIKEIYTPKVLSVSPETPAMDALAVMRANKASCIVVLAERKPVGIFTERDVVRCVARYGPNFVDMPMQDLMTCSVRTVTRETLLYEAFELLAVNKMRHLVVVDEFGHAVGVATLSDMIKQFGYDYFIKVKTIGQVMHNKLVRSEPDATLFDAARKMADMKLSFLVVCEQQYPMGVLTERDIATLISSGVSLEESLVKDHMSSPVVSMREEQPAYDAVELMRVHGIRRVVVVDESGKALGVVTQSDMVRGLESNYVETLKLIIREQGEELTKTVRQLARKTLYLDSILSSSVDLGIIALDENLKVNYFNAGAEKLLGIPARLVYERDIRTIHELDQVPFARVEQGIQLVKRNKQVSFCFERRGKDGRARYLQAKVTGIREKDSLAGFVLLLEDITEKHKAEEMIRKLAYYDVLTGLPNRVLFYERLASEISRCHRNKSGFGLMLMDVDKFKDINDTHGHHVGDRLLREIADRLQGKLRETDTISRLGGDEFCFILSDVFDAASAELIADKILKKLHPAYDIDGVVLDMRFSFGIALYPDHGTDSGTLVRLADKAMYKAKEKGRFNKRSNIFVH